MEYLGRSATDSKQGEAVVVIDAELLTEFVECLVHIAGMIDRDGDRDGRRLDERHLEAMTMHDLEEAVETLLEHKV